MEIFYWCNFMLNAWYAMLTSKFMMIKVGAVAYSVANLFTAVCFFVHGITADAVAPDLYSTHSAWRWYAFYMGVSALVFFQVFFSKLSGKMRDRTFTSLGGKMRAYLGVFLGSWVEKLTDPSDVSAIAAQKFANSRFMMVTSYAGKKFQ